MHQSSKPSLDEQHFFRHLHQQISAEGNQVVATRQKRVAENAENNPSNAVGCRCRDDGSAR